MTCPDHDTPIAECVGCTGLDRAKAADQLQFMYGIQAATLRTALAEIEHLDKAYRGAVVEAEQQRMRADGMMRLLGTERDATRLRTRLRAAKAEVERLRFCDRIGLFADGELPDAEATAFREHLALCPTCPERLVTLVQEQAVLSTLQPKDKP